MVNMDNYEQQSIFGFPEYRITKKIRLIELFGGIGSQAMALRDIGADFEHYRLVEFDKYAVQSYNGIHHTNFTTTDIRDVHGKDLAIREREILLHYDLLFPLYRFVGCRQNERYVKDRLEKRRVYKKWFALGSRTHFERVAERRTA